MMLILSFMIKRELSENLKRSGRCNLANSFQIPLDVYLRRRKLCLSYKSEDLLRKIIVQASEESYAT